MKRSGTTGPRSGRNLELWRSDRTVCRPFQGSNFVGEMPGVSPLATFCRAYGAQELCGKPDAVHEQVGVITFNVRSLQMMLTLRRDESAHLECANLLALWHG